jgi:hypothetical protein
MIANICLMLLVLGAGVLTVVGLLKAADTASPSE